MLDVLRRTICEFELEEPATDKYAHYATDKDPRLVEFKRNKSRKWGQDHNETEADDFHQAPSVLTQGAPAGLTSNYALGGHCNEPKQRRRHFALRTLCGHEHLTTRFSGAARAASRRPLEPLVSR